MPPHFLHTAFSEQMKHWKALEKKYEHVVPTEDISVHEKRFFQHAEPRRTDHSTGDLRDSTRKILDDMPAYIGTPEDRGRTRDTVESVLNVSRDGWGGLHKLTRDIYADHKDPAEVFEQRGPIIENAYADHAKYAEFDKYLANPQGGPDEVVEEVSEVAEQAIPEIAAKILAKKTSWISSLLSYGYSLWDSIKSFMNNVWSVIVECSSSWKCWTLAVLTAGLIGRAVYCAYEGGCELSQDLIWLFEWVSMQMKKAMLNIMDIFPSKDRVSEKVFDLYKGLMYQNKEFILGDYSPFKIMYDNQADILRTAHQLTIGKTGAMAGITAGAPAAMGCYTVASGAAGAGLAGGAITGPGAFIISAIAGAGAGALCALGVGGGAAAGAAAGQAALLSAEHASTLSALYAEKLLLEQYAVRAFLGSTVSYFLSKIVHGIWYKIGASKKSAKQVVKKLEEGVGVIGNIGKQVAKTKIGVYRGIAQEAKSMRKQVEGAAGLTHSDGGDFLMRYVDRDLVDLKTKETRSRKRAKEKGMNYDDNPNLSREEKKNFLRFVREDMQRDPRFKMPTKEVKIQAYMERKYKEKGKGARGEIERLQKKIDAVIAADKGKKKRRPPIVKGVRGGGSGSLYKQFVGKM